MKKCYNCGSDIKDNFKFCTQCGQKINEKNPIINDYLNYNIQTPTVHKKSRGIKYIIIGFFILLLTVLFSILMFKNVENFIVKNSKISTIQPKVEDDHFNFTIKEFVKYLNDNMGDSYKIIHSSGDSYDIYKDSISYNAQIHFSTEGANYNPENKVTAIYISLNEYETEFYKKLFNLSATIGNYLDKSINMVDLMAYTSLPGYHELTSDSIQIIMLIDGEDSVIRISSKTYSGKGEVNF